MTLTRGLIDLDAAQDPFAAHGFLLLLTQGVQVVEHGGGARTLRLIRLWVSVLNDFKFRGIALAHEDLLRWYEGAAGCLALGFDTSGVRLLISIQQRTEFHRR